MPLSLLIEQWKVYGKRIPILGDVLLAIKRELDWVLNMIEYHTSNIDIEGRIISGYIYHYNWCNVFFPKENSDMRYILREIFKNNILWSLQWCECILDVGAYLWESSIYLSKYNSKVIAIEANPKSYIIAKHNINQIPSDKIILMHGYLSKETEATSKWIIAKWCWSKIDHNSSWPIQAIQYNSLIEAYNPDGLKMDIEGWEYPLIEEMLETREFPFKKGFIEFHDLFNNDNQTLLRKFLAFLQGRGYSVQMINNKGQVMNIEQYLPPVINILFHQLP